MSCQQVLEELSNYIDDSVAVEFRRQIDAHLRTCRRCSVVLDSTKKTIRIYSDERVLEIPAGFNTRLREFFLRAANK